MHVCLWGKYLIKLDKLLSWSLISLNFQYYNHSLLSYNHSHVYIVYHGKQTLEVTFLEQSFSLYLKKLQNIIVLLYLSVFYMHTSEWKFGKNYICKQTARRVAVLKCKQEQHSNCEEGYQTKVFLLQCNLSNDLLVFIKLKFLRILNFSQSFQEQVMTCSSCNYTIWERKKNWIQLHLNLFQYLFLHNLFHLVHDKLHDEANIWT